MGTIKIPSSCHLYLVYVCYILTAEDAKFINIQTPYSFIVLESSSPRISEPNPNTYIEIIIPKIYAYVRVRDKARGFLEAKNTRHKLPL